MQERKARLAMKTEDEYNEDESQDGSQIDDESADEGKEEGEDELEDEDSNDGNADTSNVNGKASSLPVERVKTQTKAELETADLLKNKPHNTTPAKKKTWSREEERKVVCPRSPQHDT